MKILSFGEIIWDVYPNECYIGGAPLNFAAHLVKSGAEAFLLSSVGDDDLGKKALEKINRFHISSALIEVNGDKPTGQCIVTLDQQGIPFYHILSDVAYDYIQFPLMICSNYFDALSFGTLALRNQRNLSVLKEIIEKGNFGKIYCDLNLRAPFYNKDIVSFCLRNAQIVKLSETELEYVGCNVLQFENDSYEAVMKEVSRHYPTLEVILLTCGENGAYAYIVKEKSMYHCSAAHVNVVSTVGAGDSFGAVFLINYLDGKNVLECLQKATERSAYVISHFEAVPD